jgi:hypothetical protein
VLVTFVRCSHGSCHNQVPNGGAERYSGDAYLCIAVF